MEKLKNKYKNSMNKIRLNNRILVGTTIFLVIVIGILIYFLNGSEENNTYTKIPTNSVELTGTFNPPEIKAESAIVWDIKNQKVIYGKNSNQPKPLASITKLMAAVTALENVPQNTTITIDAKSLEQEGDSYLTVGSKWLLKDLIDFSLIESSNDGIVAIASAVGAIYEGFPSNRDAGRVSFINSMNEKAREIGLSNTSFSNESGLDIYQETDVGALGSAEDVAKLFSYILEEHPGLLEATSYSNISVNSLDGKRYIAQNTNSALSKIPALIGSKTGYTEISGGNLGVIIDPGINYPIAIVVLGSTFEDRFEDVLKLSSATLNYFQNARHN